MREKERKREKERNTPKKTCNTHAHQNKAKAKRKERKSHVGNGKLKWKTGMNERNKGQCEIASVTCCDFGEKEREREFDVSFHC